MWPLWRSFWSTLVGFRPWVNDNLFDAYDVSNPNPAKCANIRGEGVKKIKVARNVSKHIMVLEF